MLVVDDAVLESPLGGLRFALSWRLPSIPRMRFVVAPEVGIPRFRPVPNSRCPEGSYLHRARCEAVDRQRICVVGRPTSAVLFQHAFIHRPKTPNHGLANARV